MGKTFSGNQRIEALGFELIALIANDKKETVEKIEKEISNCSVIKYLTNKYKDNMSIIFDESSPYDIDSWEKELGDYSGWVDGNESRKFGITKDDDGLLLLLGLVLDIIQQRK